MAWFQDLANRAENLLNQIDQNAATVLNDSQKGQDVAIALDEPLVVSSSWNSTQPSVEEVKPLAPVSDVGDDPETPIETVVQDDMDSGMNFEKVKSVSPGLKSISSHSSFVVAEDIQADAEKITKLELEVQDLNKQLLNLQHLYAELRNENSNLLSQLETANFLTTTAQSEMEQYKARAQRILLEKEDLIKVKNENQPQSSDNILVNYNSELKKELEFQQEKNVELSEKVKKLSQEVSYFQQQLILAQQNFQQSSQILEENLYSEKKSRSMAEEDCHQKDKELYQKSQELGQQLHLLQSKNEEIKRLEEAIRRKTIVDVNSETEIRIKSLTETLMHKQKSLEQTTTERNALRIQLEKLENEYHKNLALLERAHTRVINVNDTDDVKSQVPQFLKMSPLDAGVTRRVKHAYSTVDAISIRTGIFLRRYPVARVCVFCYMILLHFWALVLLFSYAPTGR